jgi:hypothetical protein
LSRDQLILRLVFVANQPPGDKSADDRWRFPELSHSWSLPRAADDEESESVRLCAVPFEEVNSVCVRLESEGIPCDVDRESVSAESTADIKRIAIVVREADLEAAEAVLACEVTDTSEEDSYEKELTAKRVESFICPKCRRGLELLPLSKNWRSVRLGCLAVTVFPFVLTFVLWAVHYPGWSDLIDDPPQWSIFAWLVIVCALTLWSLCATRHKGCKECGWRSDQADAEVDNTSAGLSHR